MNTSISKIAVLLLTRLATCVFFVTAMSVFFIPDIKYSPIVAFTAFFVTSLVLLWSTFFFSRYYGDSPRQNCAELSVYMISTTITPLTMAYFHALGLSVAGMWMLGGIFIATVILKLIFGLVSTNNV